MMRSRAAMSVRNLWQKEQNRLRNSITASAFQGDDKAVSSRLNFVFDRAKKLSDFVALVTRVVICLFGAVYFTKLSHEANNFFDRGSFAAAAVLSTILSVFLQYWTIEMIFLYFLHGATQPRWKVLRIILIISAVWIDFETTRALWLVAIKLTYNNPLVN